MLCNIFLLYFTQGGNQIHVNIWWSVFMHALKLFALLTTASHRELMLSCFGITTVFECIDISSTAHHSWPTCFFPKDVSFHAFQMKTTSQKLSKLSIEIRHPLYLLYHLFLSSVIFTSIVYTLSGLQIKMLHSIWSRTDCTGTSSIVWWFIITIFEICHLTNI